MKPFCYAFAGLILLMPSSAMGQGQVVVTAVPGEDSDSSPRDDKGNIIGPERDGEFETLYAAVNFLMEHANGGIVIVNAIAPVQGRGNVTKPLEVVGMPGRNIIADGFTVSNARLAVENIRIDRGGQGATGIQAEDNSELIVRDSSFANSINGILVFGNNISLDVQNTVFESIQMKCIGLVPVVGGNVVVRDCTFTNSWLGVDDRHQSFKSTYENLHFKDLDWIGVNVELDVLTPPDPKTSTMITNSIFENIGFQGVHMHTAQNVTVKGVKATGCGAAQAFGNDGAGIGGHEGGGHFVIEDCQCTNNVGAGFFFEDGIKDVTLTNNVAQGNLNGGVRFKNCEKIRIAGGHVIQNVANLLSPNGGGISLENTQNVVIEGVEIVQNRTGLLGNGGGIYAFRSQLSAANLTVRRSSADANGGGIAILETPDDSMAKVESSTIKENAADLDGGGVYMARALGTIFRCKIQTNAAKMDGGGVAVVNAKPKTAQGVITEIRANTIEENTAAQDGGGIYVAEQSHALFIGGIPGALLPPAQDIQRNKASRHGGGICVRRSNIVVGIDGKAPAPNRIAENVAQEGNGGGIFAADITREPDRTMLIAGGNLIQKNEAKGTAPGDPADARIGNGGGIAIENSENIYMGGDLVGDAKGEAVNGNIAVNNGGGIYLYRTILTMGASTGAFRDETVRGNEALKANGGGIAVVQSSHAPGDGELVFVSPIVQRNKASATIPANVSAHQSTVGNGGGISITDESSNVRFENPGGSMSIGSDVEPALFDPSDGNVASANGGGIYVQKSHPKLHFVSIIANQSQQGCGGGIAIVAKHAGQKPGYIRMCVIQANTAHGGVEQPVPGKSRLEELVGNGGGVAFLNGADEMPIEGCKIGRGPAGTPEDLPGRENIAMNNGGGIYAHLSNPQMIVSTEVASPTTTVRANKAAAGGGIAVRGKSADAKVPLQIEGCVVEENIAVTYHGGGIAILDEANAVSIEEAQIRSNRAQKHGGGIYTRYSNPAIGTSIVRGTSRFPYHGGPVVISGNTAVEGNGGGIACENDSVGPAAPLLIKGIIIISNVAETGNGGGVAFFDNCSSAGVHFNLIGINENGGAAGNTAVNGDGGGIFVEASEPVIGGKRTLAVLPHFIPFPGLPQNIIGANSAKNGGGVAFSNGAASALFGNTVGTFEKRELANTATRMGGGVYSNSAAALIGPIVPPVTAFSRFLNGGNFIIGNKAAVGGGVAFENGSVGQLRWNVITENRAAGGLGSTGGVYVTGIGTNPAITNNTILLNQDDGIRIENGANPVVQNVILDSHTGYGVTGPMLATIKEGGTFASNDLFQNFAGPYGPGTKNLTQSRGVERANIELDPLYWNRPGKDYRLTDDSPCAPGNSPPGSLLIGAMPAAIADIIPPPTPDLVAAPYRDADWGDVDGDGLIDLAVATVGTDFILLNSGFGVFSVSREVNVPPTGFDKSEAIELGVLDGDGYLDIAVANDGTDVLVLNNGETFVDVSARLNSSGTSHEVKMADLDADGDLDILFAKEGANAFYRGDGAGGFSDSSAALGGDVSDSRDIAIGDLDADGDLDLYIANRGKDLVLLNDGTGNFTPGESPPTLGESNRVTAGDVDGDGDLDLFVASDHANTLLLNRGNAIFMDAPLQLPPFGELLRDADFADMNSDGFVDLLAVETHRRIILFNDGTGRFASRGNSTAQTGREYWESDASDIDNDGGLEVAYIKETGIEYADGLALFLPDTPPILRVSPKRVPPGELVTITGTGFIPSERHVQLIFDGVPVNGFLVNISQISFVMPDTAAEGEHALEIRMSADLVQSATVAVGELIVGVPEWQQY